MKNIEKFFRETKELDADLLTCQIAAYMMNDEECPFCGTTCKECGEIIHKWALEEVDAPKPKPFQIVYGEEEGWLFDAYCANSIQHFKDDEFLMEKKAEGHFQGIYDTTARLYEICNNVEYVF